MDGAWDHTTVMFWLGRGWLAGWWLVGKFFGSWHFKWLITTYLCY